MQKCKHKGDVHAVAYEDFAHPVTHVGAQFEERSCRNETPIQDVIVLSYGKKEMQLHLDAAADLKDQIDRVVHDDPEEDIAIEHPVNHEQKPWIIMTSDAALDLADSIQHELP